MQINTKIRYGMRTMIELGLDKKKEGVFQKDIAKNQELSEKYLDSIISSLKTAGLIRNTSGKKSGYVLNRPAGKITVYDIYRAFEQPTLIPCICDDGFCDRTVVCAAKKYWCSLNESIVNHMKKETLAHLVRETSIMAAKAK
jgi:Rrf2 family protein